LRYCVDSTVVPGFPLPREEMLKNSIAPDRALTKILLHESIRMRQYVLQCLCQKQITREFNSFIRTCSKIPVGMARVTQALGESCRGYFLIQNETTWYIILTTMAPTWLSTGAAESKRSKSDSSIDFELEEKQNRLIVRTSLFTS
jgi:hypothetical protein